ncbi:MAG: putative Ig domain-containing protein, partial [Betaproteobacteria bacterium]
MALFDGARRPLHVFAAFLLAALALFATLAEAANPVRLFALSTRANVVQGDNVLITGFVIEGSRPKTVVLRARGPSIGVANALADPMLTLVPAAGGPPVVNDDWWTAANSATLAASGFAPDHAKESALLATLDPGVYTAVVSGVAGSTGLALVEVYEFDTPDASLSGISARALVGAGDAVMIAGFIVTGDAPLPVVVRARGPSLATVGVSGALEDPLLQLVRASDQVVIATNDDWESAPNAADIAASGFPPADPRESAILMPLEPGAYTAVVSDVGNRAGVAIIEVFEAAQAPVITSADATTFIAGTQGNFVVTATGKPAPTLSLSGALPSGVTFDPATGALSGTPGPATGGVYALTFSASNGVDGPATQAFTLTVHQAPAITSGNAVTFNVGVAGMFTVTATGFPTPVLALASGTLPAGITFDAATGILSGTPATGTGGTYPLTFSATNAAATATQAFTLTVGAVRITSANTATFTVGTAGSFTVTTSATPVAATITRSGALPNGVTFVNNGDGTATLAGTPAPGTGGTYAITIQAGNGVGVPASQNFTLVVNQAAAITSANATTFVIGAAGSFTVVASGFPTPTLTLTGALPSGVTFNTATGVLSGVPAAGTGGSYPLTFTALNGVVPNATQAFTLTVNQAPAVTSVNTATFVVGTPGTFTVVTAAVPTATLITYTGTLPAGVSFTNNGNGTATLAGTPAAGTGGTYPLAISASNGVPPNATQSFTLTVNEAPAITSPNGTTFTVGTAGSFTVSVTGFPAPTLSLVGALPAGVSFDTSSGVLSGAPAPGSGGTYPVTFTATSSAGTANQAFTLTVVAPAAAANDAHSTVHDTLLNVAAPGVLSNDSGVPAPTVSSVSGSGAPCSAFPCTVSTTHGSVTLASDGSFTYTPSADFAGSDTFTYTATNATGSSSATVTLTVTNAAPVVDLNGTAGGIGFTATFTEGGAAVAIVDPAQLTVTDADHTQLTGATIVITNPIDGASESLSLACPDVSPGCSGAILAANVTYTPATHTLEILATASLADFQALLRTLTYANSSLAPDTATRDVTVTINDGISDNSPIAHAAITVSAVNNAPSITAPTSLTIAADVAHAFAGNVNVADVDAGSANVQVTLTATNGIATLSGTSGLVVSGNGTASVVATGPIASQNTALNGMTFTPTHGYSGAASLEIDIDDLGNTGSGGAKTATKTIALTVDQIPAVTTTVPTQGASAVSTATTLTVNFSEAVSASATAFALECPVGTPRALAPWSSSPATSFVLTPLASLPPATACQLTVSAAQVSDSFGQHLASNYGLGFTTNTLPTVTSTTPANGATGVQPSATITVNFSESVNATGSSFTLECPAGSPTAFTVSSSPAASFILTPSAPLTTGVTCAVGVVAAQVTDTSGQAMAANYNFGFTVAQPPAITSANAATFTVGSAGSFTVTSTGSPTATLAITAGALSAGVTFTDNGNGSATLAGTPAAGNGGSYPLTITASNGVLPNATQSFTLTVNQAPAITSANAATFSVGSPGTFTVTTSGVPIAATVSIGSGLPSGLTFTNNGNGTATIAGTPAAGTGGTYTLTITAINGVAPNATQSFTLTVNQAPAITSANYAEFTVGTAGSFTFTTSGHPAPTLAITDGTLPSGITFTDNGNGTATLSGTPAASAGGEYPLTITASNGVTPNGTQLFVLYAHSPVVAVNDTYTVLHDTVLNVVHPGVLGNDSGSPQPAIVSVTGSGAPCTVSSTPCTVDTAHGSLTLVGDGSFTYTPAADFAGTDTFTYVVYNLVGSFGTATVTITVTNAAPVVDLNGATAAGIDFAATFTEGGGDVAIVDAAQLTVTDADDTQLTGATIIITNPLDGAAESLAVTCTDAPPACKGSINVADVSYTPATHTLEILATAPLADFQALLRTLRYANGSLAPGTSARDVTVTINDGISDNSPIAHAAITVSAVNNAPSITAPASLTIAADVAHAFAGNVSVADADAGTADVQVTLTATNGTALLSGTAGLAVSGNGTATVTFVGSIASVNAALNGMTFTPTNGYTGAASLRIDVDDRGNTGSGGAKTATKTIALTVDQVPAVTTTTPTQGASAVSTTSTLTVNFSEAVTATASAFTLECPAGTPRALAPWTSSPATSFVLTPTAALPQASSCVLTVAAAQVTDGFGQHLAANYTLSFTANRRPTVASTTPVHGATGVQPSATITIGFNEPVNASGSAFTLACPSGTPKNFTVSSSPATSFTLTPDASLPTGTTCTVGVVAAQVTDGTGETMVASFAFDFTVAQPPAITSVNSAAFAVGQSGTFTVTTTGSPGGASMVITKTGALPSGVTFTDNNNGTATIAGTPAGGTGGSYPITITASNGVAPDATQPFTLTVNQAPAITSANTITFVVGYVGKSFTVTTSGVPTATSITYGGALPTGLAFTNNADGTATITGTPAAGTGGSYPLTITASNGVPPNATQSFTLVVHQAPQVTSANNATFAERVAGSFTVTATGFPVPALAISGGTLPTGVSFTDNGDGTGLIAGTPARFSGGAYPFTISATSGAFAPATQAFVLNVTAPTAAVDDTYSTVHDTARNVTAPGVLTNDWGVPAPALTSVTGSGAPCTAFPCTVTTTNGSVTLNADGSFTYTPAAEFFGIDRFDYTASNAAGSSTATVTIIVTNEPPVVDLNGATAAGIDFATTFTEGGGAVAIVDAAQLTVTDPDDTQLTGVTIILGSAPDGAAETLAVTCTDAPPACKGSIDVADVTYTPATHTLEILATASLADFQALLRTLTYDNSSLAPDTTERSVTISITDGGTGNYPVGRADITIFSVNSAPTITAPTALTIAANVAHAFAGNVSVADPDAGTGEVQVVLTATNGIATLSGTSGLFVSGNGTATVTFVGSITSVNAALNGMTFTPTNGYTGAASLRIDVDDRGNTGTGGAKTATKTITLTVDQIPAVTTTTPTQGASAVSTTSTLTVNFSEAVTATASAFALECPAGTSRALAPWT